MGVDTYFENGLYYFFYAGRRRILTSAEVVKFVDERKGMSGIEISEQLLLAQMIEIEECLSDLN